MPDRALLIGINEYEEITDLRGCVNDVDGMQGMLLTSMGFPEAGIRTLLDADAVRPNVLDGMRWLAADCAKGDRRFFHFSGHGSFTRDVDGDEADGYDEILCLHNMAWGDPSSYILDDFIRGYAEGFSAEVRPIFVLDSCHSGTGLRQVAPRGLTRAGIPKRGAEVDVVCSACRAGLHEAQTPEEAARHEVLARFAPPPPEVEVAALRAGQPRPKRAIARAAPRRSRALLVAACLPTQTAADAWFPELGKFHGAHTRATIDAFAANPKVTPARLKTALERAMKAGGFPQRPQVEVA